AVLPPADHARTSGRTLLPRRVALRPPTTAGIRPAGASPRRRIPGSNATQLPDSAPVSRTPHAAPTARDRSAVRNRPVPRGGRWYRRTRSRPSIALLLDERRDVDLGPRIRMRGRPRDETASHAHETRTGRDPFDAH